MKKSAALFVIVAAAGSVFAGDISQVNGFSVDLRTPFNFIPTSNLQYGPAFNATTAAPAPATVALPGNSVEFYEQFPAGTPNTGFANKHVAYLSTDGGASHFTATKNQSWTMNFDVLVDVAAPGVRREAGLRVENNRPNLGYTDEGLLLIASDGEVAVFGGVMPFTGLGNVYTAGTTAQVSFQYFAPGVADPVVGAYRLIFTDAVTGVHDSGIKLWNAGEPDGLFGFNDGAKFAFVAQNQYIPVINDFSRIRYNNVSIVPAPGALALMGLGGLIAGRRRR